MEFSEHLISNESKFVTIIDLSVIILKEIGRPMSVQEITKKILERRFIASETPNATVCAALLRNKKIKRISRGMYDIVY